MPIIQPVVLKHLAWEVETVLTMSLSMCFEFPPTVQFIVLLRYKSVYILPAFDLQLGGLEWHYIILLSSNFQT